MRELCDHCGEVVDRVVAGERLTVTRDGRAVAELRPLARPPITAAGSWNAGRGCPMSIPARSVGTSTLSSPPTCDGRANGQGDPGYLCAHPAWANHRRRSFCLPSRSSPPSPSPSFRSGPWSRRTPRCKPHRKSAATSGSRLRSSTLRRRSRPRLREGGRLAARLRAQGPSPLLRRDDRRRGDRSRAPPVHGHEQVYGSERSTEEDLARMRRAFGAWRDHDLDGAAWVEERRSGSRLAQRRS